LYDSQDIQQGGLRHVATCSNGAMIEGIEVFPDWAKTVLGV
jgi:hypothetical protein